MLFGLPIAVALAILLLVQAPAAIALIWRWWRPSAKPVNPQLKAAVILCVRGADETLEHCVEGILKQDYPNYELVIVVDAETDPGWKVVQEVASRFPKMKVRIETLIHRLDSCSLKCSALLQAVAGLDDSIEAIALIDADTVPQRNWLSLLLAPLAGSDTGAAAGVRWYSPSDNTWGDMIRYLWNAPAIVC